MCVDFKFRETTIWNVNVTGTELSFARKPAKPFAIQREARLPGLHSRNYCTTQTCSLGFRV